MTKRSFIILGLAAAAIGCSVLIEVDDKQCDADADCAARGPAFAAAVCRKNLCVATDVGGDAGASGNPLLCEAPAPNDAPTVKFTFAPGFAVPPTDPKPFSVSACLSLDPNCDNPVFGPIDVNALEPQDFEVPKNFNGFFQIENPDTRTGLYFMGRPLAEDTLGWAVSLPNDGTITALGVAAGEQVDLALGVMIAVARDCKASPLEGATFEDKDPGLRFYFYQTTPDANATETGPQGAVGYANLPLGQTTLSAKAADGTELTPVVVRLKADHVSFAEVFP